MLNQNDDDDWPCKQGFTESDILSDDEIAMIQENTEFINSRQKRRECDHVIGVRKHVNLSVVLEVRQSNSIKRGIAIKFSFCPRCGAKLKEN